MNAEIIIKEKRGTIIDVRTTQEFIGGNVVGSLNIPLMEIPHRINELKKLEQPLVFCCATGSRSEQATQYILQQGINCFNAGSWLNANYYQSQSLHYA